MTNKLIEMIFNNLIANRKFVIRGLGTWYIRPAKKGEFKTKYGRGRTKHKFRVSWKCSKVFKDRVNKELGK